MRRLLAPRRRAGADPRPALLSVIALMFLLLPFVLLTTSPQKLGGLGLALAGEGAEAPAVSPGPLERVEVRTDGSRLVLRAAIRSTDVTAEAGDTTETETVLPPVDARPDLAGLQTRLAELRHLDPHQQRITVIPADDLSTSQVVALVDAVRGDPASPLFEEVVLGSDTPEEEGRPGP